MSIAALHHVAGGLHTVDLERQLLPGTFENAMSYLIDHEIDLSGFDTRYKNDLTGASAYPPAMLLKLVIRLRARQSQLAGKRRRMGNGSCFVWHII
ncbi:MAG: hypothetical protein Q7J21_07285 [Rugosibacter sp.]|nr:hypothetical protein [Rugosibacter sp.]